MFALNGGDACTWVPTQNTDEEKHTLRHVDMRISICLYKHTHTHTPCAKSYHWNTHTTQAYTKSNQAHLHANHFKPSRTSSSSSSHTCVVSRFTVKCFLSTQLHTDVVQSSLMNILLHPYVMVTQGPGAAAQEHFSVVHWEVGAAVTSSWGKVNSWSQTCYVRWFHYSFA